MSYILVVGLSARNHEIIARCLAATDSVLTVRAAADAFQAREMIASQDPVMIILAMELPRMSAGEFLGLLMRHHPLPVVVVATDRDLDSKVEEKYQLLGAVRTIAAKTSTAEIQRFVVELSQVMKAIFQVQSQMVSNVKRTSPYFSNVEARSLEKRQGVPSFSMRPTVIALGASTGGPVALHEILWRLSANSPPVLIAQHISDRFLISLIQGLQHSTQMKVSVAEDGETLKWGCVYVAPPEHHMEIDRFGRIRVLSVVATERITPSINVLFNSLARHKHFSVIAALLTGMGEDGAVGLLRLHKQGSRTIAQDRKTSAVFGMPARAIEIQAASEVLLLEQIGPRILCHVASLGESANQKTTGTKPLRALAT